MILLQVLNLGSVKDWCGEELEQEEDGFTPKSMLRNISLTHIHFYIYVLFLYSVPPTPSCVSLIFKPLHNRLGSFTLIKLNARLYNKVIYSGIRMRCNVGKDDLIAMNTLNPHKTSLLYFIYSISDLRQIRYTTHPTYQHVVLQLRYGLVAAAPGPLACPSRNARPRNCLNLTLK